VGAPRWVASAALSTCCWLLVPPATQRALGPACVALSESSVGQRGTPAQAIKLLVPEILNYLDALQHLFPLDGAFCLLAALRRLAGVMYLLLARQHRPFAAGGRDPC
jgi:hypothetical protein